MVSSSYLQRAFAVLAISAFAFQIGVQSADASLVYGTSAQAYLTGTRSVAANTIVLGGGYNIPNGKLDWGIVDNGNGTWEYTYTFTGFKNQGPTGPAISHFTLDLTDDAVNDPEAVTGIVGKLEFGNKDGIVGAVKFDFGDDNDDGTMIYSFTSNRAPVWGDFYVKSGSDKTAKNVAFGDQTSHNILDYIARPNGTHNDVIPEPTAALVWATLAGVIAPMARRRK